MMRTLLVLIAATMNLTASANECEEIYHRLKSADQFYKTKYFSSSTPGWKVKLSELGESRVFVVNMGDEGKEDGHVWIKKMDSLCQIEVFKSRVFRFPWMNVFHTRMALPKPDGSCHIPETDYVYRKFREGSEREELFIRAGICVFEPDEREVVQEALAQALIPKY